MTIIVRIHTIPSGAISFQDKQRSVGCTTVEYVGPLGTTGTFVDDGDDDHDDVDHDIDHYDEDND